MPRVLPSRLLPLALGVAASASLAACGADQTAATVEPVGDTPAERAPAASKVSGLLGRLADVPASHGRLAFVNEAALADLELPLPAAEVRSIVLGAVGASRVADDTVSAAAQLGAITVLVDADGARRVVGASGALADQLESTTPSASVLAPETASAVQSCLGDPAAQVMRGSEVLGPTSGLGVSVLAATEPGERGPVLHVCAAPHYVRELHAIEGRLKTRFPKAEVGEQEIGEREIVSAVVPVDDLDASELRGLLGGGASLLELARG
ncbi:MAG: hypothetical protein J7513_08605 [Solirubrobacteraceae bacterium]|nr:hypothetical protein [Solirubrobacteraceae bacterium]